MCESASRAHSLGHLQLVIVAFVVLSLVLFAPGRADAWVETAVRSHEARVEVSRDGRAIVRHELVLKLRGGPMKSLEVDGIGTILDPLPDALVRRAVEGSQGAWPLTVSSLEDGSLRLGIGSERGIRGGSYAFSFAYGVHLKDLGRMRAVDEGVEISFIGPRLTSGVDSAKVTFVLPRAPTPPRLADQDEAEAGVLLGEVRRGANQDEIDLLRAHLAVGEPAIWKVIAAHDALDPTVLATEEQLSARPLPALRSQSSRFFKWGVDGKAAALVLSLGLFFFGLSFWKSQVTNISAKKSDARIKPLLPGPSWFRALLAGGAVSVATYFALVHEPWLSMGALAVSCAALTHLLPVRIVRPRGPGVWEPLTLPLKASPAGLPSRVFETRSLPGFLLFFGLSFAILLAAYRVLPVSNYFSLVILALILPLSPLFLTGRLSDFPELAAEQARPWLRFLTAALSDRVARVELWGRRSALEDEASVGSRPLQSYDEARLRVVLADAPVGLRALEVSLDEAAGACVLPCVIIRALEDSPVIAALPSDVPWQRGRVAEERVAVLRPSAPTTAQLLRLLKTLITNLRSQARHEKRRADKSSGSGISTSNGSASATLQAM